ncbi:MAG: hypothetical protein GF333_06265 [Candidatus Omnitrophica bacterium]|nr:hypothetical protein [Candidatus Omnitrophota bacterium]
MNRLSEYKNVFIVVTLAVVTAFVVHGVYKKYAGDLEAVNRQVEEVKEGQEMIASWRRVNKEFGALREAFAFSDPIEYKRFVEQAAYESGVDMEALRPKQREEDGYGVSEIYLEFTSETYTDILEFVNTVEHKNIQVKTMTVREARNGGKRVRADLVGYYVLQGE